MDERRDCREGKKKEDIVGNWKHGQFEMEMTKTRAVEAARNYRGTKQTAKAERQMARREITSKGHRILIKWHAEEDRQIFQTKI